MRTVTKKIKKMKRLLCVDTDEDYLSDLPMELLSHILIPIGPRCVDSFRMVLRFQCINRKLYERVSLCIIPSLKRVPIYCVKLKHLERFHGLETLRTIHPIDECDIQKWPLLKSLSYSDCISKPMLMHMTRLEKLVVSFDGCIDGELDNYLTNLKKLSLNCRMMLSVDIDRISNLTNLTTLYFGSKFGDDNTRITISTLTNLKSLSVCNNNTETLITEYQLIGLTNLTHLAIPRHISYQAISNMKSLNHLCMLRNNQITDNDLSKLTNLNNLFIAYNTTITDHGISQLTNLTKLSAIHKVYISSDGLQLLTNLTTLDLSFNTSFIITKNLFSMLTNLHNLNITNSSINIDYVSHLTWLDVLRHHDVKINGKGLAFLLPSVPLPRYQ